MATHLPPLSYAIIKLFSDGTPRCARDVIEALSPDYKGFKLLTEKDVDESLATAKENGLLDEVKAEAFDDGKVLIFFQINDYGRKMIERYL